MTKPIEIPSDRKGMSLLTARKIAKKVGATIRPQIGDPSTSYEITLGVPAINPDGTVFKALHYAPTPLSAAHTAVIETAKAAHALISAAKKVYVEENLLFEDGSHG